MHRTTPTAPCLRGHGAGSGRRRWVAAAVLALAAVASRAPAQTFEGLGGLDSAHNTFVAGLSADGSVLAGTSVLRGSFGEVIRWTELLGVESIAPGLQGVGGGITADGQKLAGWLAAGGSFFWTKGGGTSFFGPPYRVFGLSSDGTAAVADEPNVTGDGYLWTEIDRWAPLPPAAGYFQAVPKAISGDGSTVVGATRKRFGANEPYYWSQASGPVRIPTPAPFNGYGTVRAASADGSVMTGVAGVTRNGTFGEVAFLYTKGGAMQELANLGPSFHPNMASASQAYSMSADGSIVVGRVSDDNGAPIGSESSRFSPFIWLRGVGTLNLATYLRGLSPAMAAQMAGWQLGSAILISADGNTICGIGIDPEGRYTTWRAQIVTRPAPAPVLSNLSPQSVELYGAATITLEGQGFRPNSEVLWNGTTFPSRRVSATRMEIDVTDIDTSTPATVEIRVLTPAPGGGLSSPQYLTIGGGIGQSPVLDSVRPGSLAVGGPTSTLVLRGQNFGRQMQALWWGNPLPTRFVSPSELHATVDAGLLLWNDLVPINVLDPNTSDLSNTREVRVVPQVPTLRDVTPRSIQAGPASNFVIKVQGGGFRSDSVVLWDWTELPTQFVSPTEVRATVSKSLAANAGTRQVAVMNKNSGLFSGLFGFRVIARPSGGPGSPPPPSGNQPAMQISDASIAPNVVSQVFVTVTNGGPGTATNVRITSARLSGMQTATPFVPSELGTMVPGSSVQLIYQFFTVGIRTGMSYNIVLTGTSNQGNFTISRTVVVP